MSRIAFSESRITHIFFEHRISDQMQLHFLSTSVCAMGTAACFI